MKWFNNMKIVTKLIISFVIVAIIAGIIGVIGVVNINKLNTNDSILYNDVTVPMSQLSLISELYQRQRVILRDIILLTNVEDKKKEVENIKGKDKEIEKITSEYEKTILEGDGERALFDKYKIALTDYLPHRDKVIELALAKNESQAIIELQGQETDDASMAVQKAITDLTRNNIDSGKAQTESNRDTANSSETLMVVLIIIGMVLAVSLGLFISKAISKPIKKLMDAANKLANGELNINLDINTEDEVGSLAKAFDKIIVSINNLTSDANMLSDAAVEGKLSTRADASKHQGEYRKIVEGVNSTLDAVIIPLNEAEQVMKKMSINDFTVEITGQYQGTLKEFAESINGVRTRLVSVQDAIVRVSKGDTSRLEEFHKLGKRSENDQLMPAITGMMETIQNLIHEAGKLATAAVDGNLSIRGNVSKFEGGYAEIIKGMNRTMDAVAAPLQESAAVMEEMEKGNLTVSMTGNYKGEYAKMKEAINSSIHSFNSVLNEINSSAQQVASGARQVSDSAQALSQGSTEQASSVEELTASLEEISVQTKQNADNANQANELSITAKENAVQGNEQMLGMLKAMEEINESSSNISKIIKVIDEIAFQTNILALNAAVEAARAGQHGKGFAVVAEEVRNLAARSANAAKETTGLIEGSIKKSEGGTRIANETALALNKIVDGVAKAATLVGEIASASNEQAAAIAQINQGIMQVSQVTQTNSETSEESAAASEELSSQAELLNELVGKFNLKKGNSAIKNIDDLSPEILRMLENMSEKKRSTDTHMHEKKAEAKDSNMTIALSDSEFGKY